MTIKSEENVIIKEFFGYYTFVIFAPFDIIPGNLSNTHSI